MSQPADQDKLTRLLFLPCCMVIAGYNTSSDNSNSQQQPTAGYSQTRKSLPDVSQQRRVNTTNVIQFKYANTVPTVLCTSNGLICDYNTGIHDKRIVTLCIM